MASQKHINSSTTSTEPGSENKLFLTLSLSLPLCFTLSLACMHKQSQAHTHIHARTLTQASTHTHTQLAWYVHDLTPVSEVYEHQACCHAKFSTLSTHRHIPSLYTSELFWTSLEIITHE